MVRIFETALYTEREKELPSTGKHILAHYDDETVVVYQAFCPEIAEFALEEGEFANAPGFNLHRITWIKPGFLWMMHRSGWATKINQERVLAIWLDRVGFDAILRKAVMTSFHPALHTNQQQWQARIKSSAVRVQWDPDYAPDDSRLARKAIQIGLGGKTAMHYAHGGWIIDIADMTDMVREQKVNATAPFKDLFVPVERPYPVFDPQVARRIGVISQ